MVVVRGRDGKILFKKVYKSFVMNYVYKKVIEDFEENLLFVLKEL